MPILYHSFSMGYTVYVLSMYTVSSDDKTRFLFLTPPFRNIQSSVTK